MEYISLYKKFFTTNDNAKKEYESRFNSPSSVKLDFDINGNQAFFLINKELLNIIERINMLNARVILLTKANRELPPIILKWILNHTFVEEIQMTNEIEGVTSTRKEIKELMNIENPKKYIRLYGLVNKYNEIINNDEFNQLNSSQDIRNLYDKIMLQDIIKNDKKNVPDGLIFRNEIVEVQSSGRSIHKGIYPEDKIIHAMDKALHILNDERLSLLIRVAIFHYCFGYIHPFYDGNGRMARFISSYYLSSQLDALCALQLSVACKQNQKKYYESFKITNDSRNKADLTYFILSFLEILEFGLIELEKVITEKIEIYVLYNQMILNRKENNKHENNVLIIFLQNYLFDIDGLTQNDLIEITHLTKKTIKKIIDILLDEELIIVDKNMKPYIYRLNFDKLIIS